MPARAHSRPACKAVVAAQFPGRSFGFQGLTVFRLSARCESLPQSCTRQILSTRARRILPGPAAAPTFQARLLEHPLMDIRQ